MLDNGTELAVNPPSAGATLEHKACWDLVGRIVSGRLWLTDVKMMAEVRPSLLLPPITHWQ